MNPRPSHAQTPESPPRTAMKPYPLLGRAALFIAGTVIGGLALAFVIVFIHPQLLLRPGIIVQAPPTAAATPAVAAGAAGSDASRAQRSAPGQDPGAHGAAPEAAPNAASVDLP